MGKFQLIKSVNLRDRAILSPSKRETLRLFTVPQGTSHISVKYCTQISRRAMRVCGIACVGHCLFNGKVLGLCNTFPLYITEYQPCHLRNSWDIHGIPKKRCINEIHRMPDKEIRNMYDKPIAIYLEYCLFFSHSGLRRNTFYTGESQSVFLCLVLSLYRWHCIYQG